MNTYIALLRGVNVSGKNRIKMAELKEELIGKDFAAVRTYIQSGNLIFKHPEASNSTIATKIQALIYDRFGHSVEVWVRERSKFKQLAELNPYGVRDEQERSRIYFVFLMDEPSAKLVEELDSQDYQNEEFSISQECIYLLCHAGYGQAKCNNNFFEQRLKLSATTRNHRTVQTLLDISADIS